MIVETKDTELIKSIVTHDRVYDLVSDDGSPKKEDYIPIIGDGIYWLSIVDDNEIIGAYLLHMVNAITYEIHTCLLPSAYGKKARDAAKDVLNWMVENTNCEKIITHVPEFNRLALRYAKKAGLMEEGIIRKSFKKNGKVYDQVLLGITREEICQQQYQA